MIETKVVHKYLFYGRWVDGYGPSMDPHRCGDPNEPCFTITSQREIGPWKQVEVESHGLDTDDAP